MRRYLQHVLPKGLRKIRYCGLWHSSHKHHVLKLINLMEVFEDCPSPETKEVAAEQTQAIVTPRCPHCKGEHLTLIENLPRPRARSPSISDIRELLKGLGNIMQSISTHTWDKEFTTDSLSAGN